MTRFDFPVIDAHIHPFPEAVYNTAFFGTPATPAEFVAEMQRVGIGRACGSVIRRLDGFNFEEIRELNRAVLKSCRDFPDFLIPGIHVHPYFPEESCGEVELMHREHQVRWVGELVPYFMNYQTYATPPMFRILEVIRDLDLTVNIHPSSLPDIEQVLSNFPTLKLVIAHPEGAGSIKDKYELMKRYPNAYLDLSGTGLFRWGMLRYGIDMLGKERFLFGTDFPICNPRMMLEGVLNEKLTDAELKAVLHDNFLNLLGP